MCRTPRLLYYRVAFAFTILIMLMALRTIFSTVAFASGFSNEKPMNRFTAKTQVSVSRPDKQSLLIVLLDRSGSLVEGERTDPNHYSTSVTRALADLWPGKMVVITFPKVSPLALDQVAQLGPYDLTDPTQRQTLKNSIPEADPEGNTPLGPAMDRALGILQKGSVPAGSQAIIITDGLPRMSGDLDGAKEKVHIENDLLKQFRQSGIPINTFGLKITSPDAKNLLNTIATRTGGHYMSVQSPTELARQVIQLYASWLGLRFQDDSDNRDDHGNYAVNITELANRAQIIVFRSAAKYPITITDPNGSVLRHGVGVQQSLDAHYQIDALDVTPPVVAGTYKVFAGRDPEAQVYWLVDTSLQVHIKSPTGRDVIYTGRPAKITAELLNKENKRFLLTSHATLTADVTLTARGQSPSTPEEVPLTQQGGQNLFIADMPIYSTPGTVQIVVKATYEGIRQQSNTETVKVEQPPIPPCTTFKCFVDRNQGYILGIGVPIATLCILLVVAWLLYRIWRKQPELYGYLMNARNRRALELNTHRPLPARLFKKSIVTMQELASHPEGMKVIGTLAEEPMGFVATRSGMSLRALQGDLQHIGVRTAKGEQKFSKDQREIPLDNPSTILKKNNSEVIFQIAVPRSLTTVHS